MNYVKPPGNQLRLQTSVLGLMTLTLLVFTFTFVPAAKAEEGVSPLVSENQIARSIKTVVRDTKHAREENPDFNLYDIDSFVRLYDTFPGTDPGEFTHVLKSLKKLDRKYEGNNAYLYVSSYIVVDVLAKPESFSDEQVEALTAFLDALPQNHGSVGRLQKIRIINALIEEYPDLADTLYQHLDVEELLVSNAAIARTRSIVAFPGDEEYVEVGGDPLVPLFGEISLENTDVISRLLPSADEDKRAWAEEIASIDRYQYFRGELPTRLSVETAERAIAEERKEWQDKKFINDTVLYGTTEGEDNGFLNEDQLSRFEELSRDVEVFVADEHEGRTPAQARTEFLKAIEKTDEPITAVLSTHGNDWEVVFQNASGSKEAILWADELANAFAKRYKKDPERSGSDVVILETCSAGTYGIIFLEELTAQEMPVPIVIAGGEAGQSTYSQEEGGSEFANHYLFNGEQTIGDLYDNYTWDLLSNPLILVPETSNPYLPLQVS